MFRKPSSGIRESVSEDKTEKRVKEEGELNATGTVIKDNKSVAASLKAHLAKRKTIPKEVEEKRGSSKQVKDDDDKQVEETRDVRHEKLNRELYRMLREDRVGSSFNDEIEKRYNLHSSSLRGLDDSEVEDVLADTYNSEKDTRKRKRERPEKSHSFNRTKMLSSYEHDGTLERVVDECRFCFENLAKFQLKHLIISFGDFTFLSLVRSGSVCAGHCFISTMTHQVSSRQLSDEVFEEVINYKKSLYQMFFETEGKEVIFFETCKDLQRQRQHLVIECVPLSRADASEAPAFFKKAILESESEWHSNKKLIETQGWRGLRKSIPENFPYFHVQFGCLGGYCHVIEEEERFPWNFGRQVIAGILKQDPPFSKVTASSAYTMKEDMERLGWFLAKYERYDWTKLLDEPE
eukprot:jgi/Galph1/1812/GphlegSOOS_G473.1